MKEYYFQTVERVERFFVYKNRDEYEKHRKEMERFGYEVKRNMGIKERVNNRQKLHDLYGDIEVFESTDLMGVKGMYFYRVGYYKEQLVEEMGTV